MSKPKNMTAEEDAEWREWHAKECRRRYLANRENILEKSKQYRKDNQESLRPKKAEWNKRWREKNRSKVLKREAEIRVISKERIRNSWNKHSSKKKSQKASDQFFIMAGAAQQISVALKNKQQ